MTDEMELMQLTMGCGHVLYSGGGFGADEIAEDMAKAYGVQNEMIVAPNHPRAKFNSPATVELMMTANEAINKGANTLGRKVPTHFFIFQ